MTRYLRVLTGANKDKESLLLLDHKKDINSMALNQDQISKVNKGLGTKSLLNKVIDLK